MKLEEFAAFIVRAAEEAGTSFMLVGALAAGAYGVARSTRDVDLLVAVHDGGGLAALTSRLESLVDFDPQVVFDTLTWGRRHVGVSRSRPPYKVELFELFDDPFVQSEFARRRLINVPLLRLTTWIPTAEDVLVQKLRWGRSKDLDDARDVLAVQGTETLDMGYVERWCATHGTTERLQKALSEIPPL